jgi:hypothetical protein
MHVRKRSFTEKNRDIRRSCMASIYDVRIRSDTVRNGFRIRRSCKNTEKLKFKLLYSVYGDTRLPYTVVYHRITPVLRVRRYTTTVYNRILSYIIVYVQLCETGSKRSVLEYRHQRPKRTEIFRFVFGL